MSLPHEAADVTTPSREQVEMLQAAAGMVIPEAILVGAACALFALAVLAPRRGLAVLVGLFGVAGAAVAASVFGPAELTAFGPDPAARTVAVIDPTGAATFVRWLSLGAAVLFLLLSWPELRDDIACEYVGCTLVVVAGTSLAGRANDLISLFLTLELVSIPTYVLLYLPVRTKAGQEAATKYFLLSVLSSGVLLFGFSYLYGMAGTTNLGAVAGVLSATHSDGASAMALVGAVLVVAGLGFRIAAFPFHFYAPDVYQGGPTGVIAQVAVVPKIVGFVALARVFGLIDPPGGLVPFSAANTLIPLTLWVLAGVTMTFGNVLALLQDDLKRLFAYSGIAHTGYMLIGLLVASALPGKAGTDAVLVYLVAYVLMTAGAFAVLMSLSDDEASPRTVDDLGGLGESRPTAAFLLMVFLLSLIGIPLTAGFVGKLLLFVGAFEVPSDGPLGILPKVMVVVAAVNAAIGAVYYLRIVGVMYLRSPLTPQTGRGGLLPLKAAVLCAVATVAIGAYPNPVARLARSAAGESIVPPKTPVAF